MPQLPHSIELHDSLLAGAETRGETLVLMFRPAYIHQAGKGWRQDADLSITNPVGWSAEAQLPCRVSDGTLKTAHGPYHNLLTLPLDDPGPVNLRLEFIDGTVPQVQGDRVRVSLHGEPTFIESVS